jgi:serine-type D-Ala-D-Ala carboxypeptidase/endopeptidase
LQGKAGHLWRGRSNQFDPGEALRTDDLAAKAGTCERISLHRHLGGRTITLNGSGIRECRFKWWREGEITTIVEPTQAQVAALVAPYLKTQASGLGFAIGCASPGFAQSGSLYFAGNVTNQFGQSLDLGATTPFEIASISKTFTATLYARLIRVGNPNLTIGDFSQPYGPLPISPTLAGITLDELMSYTSGLPQDNEDAEVDSPPELPSPYSMPGMLSYLRATPPPVTSSGQQYTYSNLAFAIMSAILASGGTISDPRVGAFVRKMREHVFAPLGIHATYFDAVSLAELPLGFNYNYRKIPVYSGSSPGWEFFPAYFGAGGIVATPSDMFQWLLFNMGIVQNAQLSPLLSVLQTPATTVTAGKRHTRLGLGWFISPGGNSSSASVFKDGDLHGFGSYIAFLPSPDPGVTPSQAGVFVLLNAEDITDTQEDKGVPVAVALAHDLLLIMQGQTPPTDKSHYPRSTPHVG